MLLVDPQCLLYHSQAHQVTPCPQGGMLLSIQTTPPKWYHQDNLSHRTNTICFGPEDDGIHFVVRKVKGEMTGWFSMAEGGNSIGSGEAEEA